MTPLKHRPHVSRLSIAAVLPIMVTLMTALLMMSAPLAQADTMGFDARPLPGSPNAELGFFKFGAAAGESARRVLVLTNHTDKAKTIRLAPCDGLAAVYGGVAYSDSGTVPQAVGSWIKLSRTAVDVPGGSSVQVPFDVRVPADVNTGEHLGGIAVWEPAAATSTGSGKAGGNAASTKITMVTRMVLTVFVTTPGPAVPDLTISGVKAQARPDGMYMLVAVANDGTAATSGQGTIALQSEGFQQKIDLGDMVPGAVTGYPVKWKSDPSKGAHQAQVQISYDNGSKVASWSGDFTVGKDDTAALTDRLVAPGNQGGSTTPWLVYGLIGGLVLIVLIMGVALLRRRRPETG